MPAAEWNALQMERDLRAIGEACGMHGVPVLEHVVPGEKMTFVPGSEDPSMNLVGRFDFFERGVLSALLGFGGFALLADFVHHVFDGAAF